jgi:serine/threonine-protein kinase
MPVPPTLAAALADRYTLERELGQGGMATVYLATDVRHQRRVAIKVLHQDIAAAMGVERFLKEIQLTAALQHPHILPLFDSGAAAERAFYVMPYVEGETLRARLDRERQLPVADALRLTQEVASALAYAHQRGIVHRDIKPENILLQDGRVLVADFGIALAASEAGGGARLTQTGISLGTPQYMSPEQAMGERTIDARTDLFALGAMAYEMLAGEPPFSGPSVQAIVSKVLTSQPVPVEELRRNVPEPAAAAIMSALEKLPADRPASAEQFIQLLSGATTIPIGRASGARKAAPARSLLQRLLPWGAGIAAGVALGTGAMAWRGSGVTGSAATSDPLRFLFAPIDSQQLQTICCGRMFAIAPDGRSLVYQARPPLVDTTKPGQPVRLFRREFSALAAVPLDGTDGATSLSISPDGAQLAFVTGNRLMRMPLAGGPVSTVATLPPGFVGGTDWRDAEHIVVAVLYTLYEVSTKDGQLKPIVEPNQFLQQVTGPATIPSNGAVLFSYTTRDEAPRVHFLARGSKTPKPLMVGASPHYVPAWKALVIDRQGRLLAFPFDPEKGDTLGAGVPFAEGVALRSPVLAHGEFDIAPTGVFAHTHRQDGSVLGWTASSRVAIRERGSSMGLPLPVDNLFVYELHFSPDGKKVLMTARNSEQDGVVFVYDLERRAYQRVSGPEETFTSTWNSRGDSIVYVERHSKTLKIRAADGTGTPAVFADLRNWSEVVEMDVRGDIAVFSGRRQAGSASTDIGMARRGQATDVVPVVSTPNDEETPALSPDGHWIAYGMTQSGKTDVYVSPFPDATSRTVVSVNGGRQPVWSGDGRTLSFVDGDGVFTSVAFRAGTGSAAPTFGPPQELYRRGYARFWTLAPDGSKLLTIDTAALYTLLGLEIVLGFRPTF